MRKTTNNLTLRLPEDLRNAVESWVEDYNYVHNDRMKLSDILRVAVYKFIKEVDVKDRVEDILE